MLQRAITGTFFVLVLVAGYLYSGLSAWALSTVIFLLGFREFNTITRDNKHYKINPIFWLSAASISMAMFPDWAAYKWFILSFNLVLIPVALISELYRKQEQPIETTAMGVLGLLYTALIYFIFLSAFQNSEYEGTTAIGFYILIWINDTFAYLSGRFFGKNKLFERISPKKTWEGSIGGGLCTLGISYVLSIFFTQLNPIQWLIIAVIAIIFGALGDLVESLLKRNYGIKDSGNILPGHGGILDRFDAALLAAPILYFFLNNFVNQSLF